MCLILSLPLSISLLVLSLEMEGKLQIFYFTLKIHLLGFTCTLQGSYSFRVWCYSLAYRSLRKRKGKDRYISVATDLISQSVSVSAISLASESLLTVLGATSNDVISPLGAGKKRMNEGKSEISHGKR